MRQLLHRWEERTGEAAARQARQAEMAEPMLAAAHERLGGALTRWRETHHASAATASAAEELAAEHDTRRLAEALRPWRVSVSVGRRAAEAEAAAEAAARRFEESLPEVDPVAEVRRFILSWRHRKRAALKRWRGTLHAGVAQHAVRLYLMRWVKHARLSSILAPLVKARGEVSAVGSAFRDWVQNASVRAVEIRLLERGEIEHRRKVFSRTMERLSTWNFRKEEQVWFDLTSMTVARARALYEWSQAVMWIRKGGAIDQLCSELRTTLALSRGWLAWSRLHARRREKRTVLSKEHPARQLPEDAGSKGTAALDKHAVMRRAAGV
jgi:hypothetical protein